MLLLQVYLLIDHLSSSSPTSRGRLKMKEYRFVAFLRPLVQNLRKLKFAARGMFHWQLTIVGPAESPYSGGVAEHKPVYKDLREFFLIDLGIRPYAEWNYGFAILYFIPVTSGE